MLVEGRLRVVETSVKLTGVVKRYGHQVAVDHVSLDIRPGEFFSLLGPSGSGKTTTLRLIAGFEHPDQGDLFIQGQPMAGIAPHRRPVNTVFQNYALFPHLTVYDNVAFGLRMRRAPEPTIKREVDTVLDMVQLIGKQARFPSRLSGGEQQRVALARALVNRPTVLLLDEPLGALDQQLRQEMQVELKTIQEQVGITFVCVTHHQEEALTMSDRMAVLEQGRVLQVGTPQDIYEAPASVSVARFIGSSNVLQAKLSEVHGHYCTLATSFQSPILARRPLKTDPADSVDLSMMVVRPERLRLSVDRHAAALYNVVPARVLKAIYNGDAVHYQIGLAGEVTWLAKVPLSCRDEKRFKPGESVFVHWHADDAVVLAE